MKNDVAREIAGGLIRGGRGILPLSSGRDAESILQGITSLANAAQAIEGRLLRVMREVAQGGVRLDGFLTELSLLAEDLQRCLRQVIEMTERRDLTFRAIEELREIDRQCVWLYRKTRLEKVFFMKLHLETRLRSLISEDAFRVYEELLDAEDQERALLARGNAEIRKLLLAETTTPPGDGL